MKVVGNGVGLGISERTIVFFKRLRSVVEIHRE